MFHAPRATVRLGVGEAVGSGRAVGEAATGEAQEESAVESARVAAIAPAPRRHLEPGFVFNRGSSGKSGLRRRGRGRRTPQLDDDGPHRDEDQAGDLAQGRRLAQEEVGQ